MEAEVGTKRGRDEDPLWEPRKQQRLGEESERFGTISKRLYFLRDVYDTEVTASEEPKVDEEGNIVLSEEELRKRNHSIVVNASNSAELTDALRSVEEGHFSRVIHVQSDGSLPSLSEPQNDFEVKSLDDICNSDEAFPDGAFPVFQFPPEKSLTGQESSVDGKTPGEQTALEIVDFINLYFLSFQRRAPPPFLALLLRRRIVNTLLINSVTGAEEVAEEEERLSVSVAELEEALSSNSDNRFYLVSTVEDLQQLDFLVFKLKDDYLFPLGAPEGEAIRGNGDGSISSSSRVDELEDEEDEEVDESIYIKTYNFKKLLRYDDHYRWRIKKLISSHLSDRVEQNRHFALFDRLVREGAHDELIFQKLLLHHRKQMSISHGKEWTKKRNVEKARQFAELLPRSFRPKNFLDIGSHTFYTPQIAKCFSLDSSNVHICSFKAPILDDPEYPAQIRLLPDLLARNDQDSDELMDDEEPKPKIENDRSLLDLYADVKEKDGGFDLIFVNILHLLKEPEALLKQIYELLNYEGLVVLKEFDSPNEAMASFLDLMNGMFARVWSDPPEVSVFCGHFRAFYRSRAQWKELFDKTEFLRISAEDSYRRPVYNDPTRLPNPYFLFADVFQKAFLPRHHHSNRTPKSQKKTHNGNNQSNRNERKGGNQQQHNRSSSSSSDPNKKQSRYGSLDDLIKQQRKKK